ncbi:hypothetical protein RCJ22_34015 [Vibrio sp. FNV 38]|nr:hypothetical protein [Vibrio sp. FNV 38]
MQIKKINDTKIREMMTEKPQLFPGMFASYYYYIGIVRQEMTLYEHQANPSSPEQLLADYMNFKDQCTALPEM